MSSMAEVAPDSEENTPHINGDGAHSANDGGERLNQAISSTLMQTIIHWYYYVP